MVLGCRNSHRTRGSTILDGQILHIAKYTMASGQAYWGHAGFRASTYQEKAWMLEVYLYMYGIT